MHEEPDGDGIKGMIWLLEFPGVIHSDRLLYIFFDCTNGTDLCV